MEECDIVVTNPPFTEVNSLFKLLQEVLCKAYIIIAPLTSLKYSFSTELYGLHSPFAKAPRSTFIVDKDSTCWRKAVQADDGRLHVEVNAAGWHVHNVDNDIKQPALPLASTEEQLEHGSIGYFD